MDDIDIIKAALAGLTAQAAPIAEQRAYFDGDHPLVFVSPRLAVDFGHLRGVCDNLIPNVVSATVDRMKATGFAPNAPEWETAAEQAWDVYQRSRMEQQLPQVLEDAAIDDYAGLVVWPDSRGKARIYPQKASQFWARPSEERPGELVCAVKLYKTDLGVPALDLLLPDRVATFQSRTVPAAGAMPQPSDYELVDESPNPLGEVPARILGPRLGEVRPIIKTQALLNRAQTLLAMASENTAWPVLALIGAEPRRNEETGEREPLLRPGPNHYHELPGRTDNESQDVSLVKLDGSDLTRQLAEVNDHRMEMARISRTPAHMMLQDGNYPSGQALRTAESGYLGKLSRRKNVVGPALADIAAMGVQLDAYQQTGAVPERAELTTVWAAHQYVDELQTAQAIDALVQAGVSLAEALVRVGGWSREDAEAEQRAGEQRAALAAERAATQFTAAPLAG